jgi:hypothetical protein
MEAIMARAFTRLSLVRLLGLVLALSTLTACVAPRHGGYYGGGYQGRGYAQHQPVHRGGWHGGPQRHWR